MMSSIQTGDERVEENVSHANFLGCYSHFFFSSRRRHTRFDCDWSSDVCSSDLVQQKVKAAQAGNQWAAYDLFDAYYRGKHGVQPDAAEANKWLGELVKDVWVVRFEQIGRASCRERV